MEGGRCTNVVNFHADAYTYLGIASGNPWGIRASIYSSKDIFAEINKRNGKPTPSAPTGPKRSARQQEDNEGDAMEWTF